MSLSHSNKTLVGIHGGIQSGKDTLAALLSQALDLKVDRFAAPLYQMAKQVDPAFHPNMSHEAKAAFVLGRVELGTRRNFLEKLGTEFGRELIDPDIWITLQDERFKEAKRGLIICDVRVPNEQEWLLDQGGYLFHLSPDWPTVETASHHFTANKLELRSHLQEKIIVLEYGKPQQAVAEMLHYIRTPYADSLRINEVSLDMGE